MAFALTVVYLVTYYLTPVTLFGPLAAVHIELILAALVSLVSFPALARTFLVKTPQTFALLGLSMAVPLSVIVGMGWPGGGVKAFLDFIPNAFAYFLICLHCTSKKKVQIVVLMLSCICLFVIFHGIADSMRIAHANYSISQAITDDADIAAWNIEHPYLLAMRNDTGEWFYRLRGLGEINDPNDFGQLLTCVIPLMFIFWRPKKTLFNLACVLVPVGLLVWGTYLTHSRGALLALIVVSVLAARRRIGTLPSVLLGGTLFVAAMALHFTGGRDISAESGSDRTDLWGQGLQMLKTHPVFGVGFGNFADSAGLTAHNSIVVCAAELGLFGLFFWSLFLFPTIRDAMTIASPGKVSEGEPVATEKPLYPEPFPSVEEIDKAEINRLGRLVLLSLTGFLAAALFLSRAYVLTLFLLGGLAEAVYQMAAARNMIGPRLALGRALAYAGATAASLVLMMYVFLRVLNLMH